MNQKEDPETDSGQISESEPDLKADPPDNLPTEDAPPPGEGGEPTPPEENPT